MKSYEVPKTDLEIAVTEADKVIIRRVDCSRYRGKSEIELTLFETHELRQTLEFDYRRIREEITSYMKEKKYNERKTI